MAMTVRFDVLSLSERSRQDLISPKPGYVTRRRAPKPWGHNTSHPA